MKVVAEELKFPQALVSLRHQAVHESRTGNMQSDGVIQHGLKQVQTYLLQQYWEPVFYQLQKRESLLSQAYSKLQDYKVHKHRTPTFTDPEEQRKTIAKIVKANFKLPKKIDPGQLGQLVNFFIEKTLSVITISFTNFSRLQKLVRSYDTVAFEAELNQLVTTQFKQKPEFLCFVYAFEQKYSQFTASHVCYTACIKKMNEAANGLIESPESTKETYERSLRLLSLFQLLTLTLQLPFVKLVSTKDQPLITLRRFWD